LIQDEFGRVGTLLEIGCGEGVQTEHLRRSCNSMSAIDVSRTAVERARTRLPDVDFTVGDLRQQSWITYGRRFDLVVAYEVLDYIADVSQYLRTMNTVGRACLVTFFTPEAPKLAAAVETTPNLKKGWIHYQGTTWLVAWWRNVSLTIVNGLGGGLLYADLQPLMLGL
jgi:cyclopropane fatty-acyl-phospholipid synthase-like methyltransferase